jgi:hypothetical protein
VRLRRSRWGRRDERVWRVEVRKKRVLVREWERWRGRLVRVWKGGWLA